MQYIHFTHTYVIYSYYDLLYLLYLSNNYQIVVWFFIFIPTINIFKLTSHVKKIFLYDHGYINQHPLKL